MVFVTSGVSIRVIVICLEEPSGKIQFKNFFPPVPSLSLASIGERERVLAIELLRWGFIKRNHPGDI